MYTLTIIRFSFLTLNFQNTEYNGYCSRKDVEKELQRIHADFGQVEKFLDLKIRQSTTIESNYVDKTWFAYITKLS